MQPLLETRNLVKSYAGLQAVNGLSFSVEPGACYGLLGPNGAGKSTTMEMIEGIVRPDSGEILYRGQSVDESFRYQVGIQFQSTSLQDFQTVREALQMFAAFYPAAVNIDDLIEVCHLGDYVNRDTRKLSGGQRQRVLLAIALVNDPSLVLLDEPTTGLDPQSRRNFWTLIEDIKRAGKTIVLTTHYMEEAYRLCDVIAIVDHGKKIVEGRPDDLLREHFAPSVIRLPGHAYNGSASDLPDSIQWIDNHYEWFTDDIASALAELERLQFNLEACRISAPTLEDLFLKLTGHSLRG